MLALGSPKGLSGSARKWPVSNPHTQGPWWAAWGSRADVILSAFLRQKPQGPTQVCLKSEALESPRSPEVTKRMEAVWGYRDEKGEDERPCSLSPSSEPRPEKRPGKGVSSSGNCLRKLPPPSSLVKSQRNPVAEGTAHLRSPFLPLGPDVRRRYVGREGWSTSACLRPSPESPVAPA